MPATTPRILINVLSVAGGGGHSYAFNLIRELDRDARGFHFTFLIPPGRLEEIETEHVTLQPVRLFGSGRALSVVARFAYEQLVLPIRARRYDVVYAAADLASPFFSVPIVIALRNLNIYDHTYYDTLRLRVLEKVVRVGIRRATRMIFPSQAAATAISERMALPHHIVRVVPHGVDTDAFDRASDREGGTPFLFLPAAIERHKNIEVLIDAIPHLSDARIEFRIAGTTSTDPVYVDELLARARRIGVEDRFRLLGPVPYERVVSFYRGAIALVFPSMLETFGHPMLEAMVAGTPVIASDIPAFREIGKDAALFFPPRDPVALARMIDELLANSNQREELIAKGRERSASFSWRKSTDALCAVFREVLE
jgi:glycosyltransferase involved in cell wall biosynthesis